MVTFARTTTTDFFLGKATVPRKLPEVYPRVTSFGKAWNSRLHERLLESPTEISHKNLAKDNLTLSFYSVCHSSTPLSPARKWERGYGGVGHD